jgi:hypothetical protein
VYSLVGTAKLNGIDPQAYLAHVLGCIANQPINRVDELLPWRVSSELKIFNTEPEPSGRRVA